MKPATTFASLLVTGQAVLTLIHDGRSLHCTIHRPPTQPDRPWTTGPSLVMPLPPPKLHATIEGDTRWYMVCGDEFIVGDGAGSMPAIVGRWPLPSTTASRLAVLPLANGERFGVVAVLGKDGVPPRNEVRSMVLSLADPAGVVRSAATIFTGHLMPGTEAAVSPAIRVGDRWYVAALDQIFEFDSDTLRLRRQIWARLRSHVLFVCANTLFTLGSDGEIRGFDLID